MPFSDHLRTFPDHLRTVGGALRNWFIAMAYDAAAVGAMWLVGLWIIGVPWAPFWALLGGALQFVPNFGPILSLMGPVLALLLSDADGMHFVYLLILYAIIAVTDGIFLQPYLFKRQSKVPIWASLLAPIVLGIVIPFWGVLLAPPLLAIVYAFRARQQALTPATLPPATAANVNIHHRDTETPS